MRASKKRIIELLDELDEQLAMVEEEYKIWHEGLHTGTGTYICLIAKLFNNDLLKSEHCIGHWHRMGWMDE